MTRSFLKCRLSASLAALLCGFACLSQAVVAADSVITVTGPDSAPLAGAMVSFDGPVPGARITRFTAVDGSLVLPPTVSAGAQLELRYPGMVPARVSVQPTEGRKTVRLKAQDDVLRQLSSAAFLELLPAGDQKKELILNCGTCHEISYDRIAPGGVPRDTDGWAAAIAMMRAMDAYEVIPPDFDDEGYARWLAEHLDAVALASLTARPVQDGAQLAKIEITEFALPEADSLPHDLVLGPDGRVWVTAFFYDELWALDARTGAVERISVDDDPTVNAQPRALKFDADGVLWLVNGGTEEVVRFDPRSGDQTHIDVGMYAHSIDLDPRGHVWVNDYFASSERVARVDARSLEVSVFPVPPARRPASEGLPLPYGLQVDSRGILYSTQLAANTLVSFDTRDRGARLYPMPEANSGPRRPGLDGGDRLWIPEFNTGHLAVFDPHTASFSRVRLGDASLGLYDVEVDRVRDEVWATGSLASSMIRYRPSTGEILHVPLPTEPAYTRHIAIDGDSGDVWTAYSSLPAAKPRVVRLHWLP